jgi:hypothetical protein
LNGRAAPVQLLSEPSLGSPRKKRDDFRAASDQSRDEMGHDALRSSRTIALDRLGNSNPFERF